MSALDGKAIHLQRRVVNNVMRSKRLIECWSGFSFDTNVPGRLDCGNIVVHHHLAGSGL